MTVGTGTGNPGSVNRVTGTVVGTMERWINATGTDILYPIGTASYYRPVTVHFNALTGGSLIASFNSSAPGNQGLPVDDNGTTVYNALLEGYWDLNTANSLVSNDFNLSLTGNGFSSFPIVPETRILSRTGSSADWLASGTHLVAQGTTARRDNITILSGDYALADTVNCNPPATTPIIGPVNVCTSAVGQTYSVENHGGSSYAWTVTGGSIVTGQGSSIITVNWGPTGMIGMVEVIETNACSQGELQQLVVNVDPIPTSVITGPITSGAGTTGVMYSVEGTPGYTYAWTTSFHGTVASGDGTASITVNWNTAGSATVEVTATHTGCGTSAEPVLLNVEVYDVIISAQDGPWEDPATWVGGVVPNQILSARVVSPHTVTVNATAYVNNLTIDAGATLDNQTFQTWIYGDYTVNGTHSGSGDINLRMYGSEAVIDGTGNITHTGYFYIGTGNKSFAPTADLTFADGLRINDNLIITNNGHVRFGLAVYGDVVGSTWVNAENATLEAGERLFSNGLVGTLVASAPGNTVVYSRPNIVTVKQPTGGNYHNLVIAGTSVKTLEGDINVLGRSYHYKHPEYSQF